MSVGKTNPMRQQMINMMYLVLTALLALNVSAEILNAFRVVNSKMDSTIGLIDKKNDLTNTQLTKLYNKTPDAVQVYYDKMTKANEIANTLYAEIEKYKQLIIEESGGIEEENWPHERRKKP